MNCKSLLTLPFGCLRATSARLVFLREDHIRRRLPLWLFQLLVIVTLSGSCTSPGPSGPTPPEVAPVPGSLDRGVLVGSGSTAVAPILQDWISEYKRSVAGITVHYRLLGSDAGILDITAGNTDYGISDVPITSRDVVAGTGASRLVEVPVVGFGVAIAYNLPGVESLRLRPDTLAQIFMGRVGRWDDPAVKADNPSVTLPSLAITVVHRADPSGTTGVLTRYLTQAAPKTWLLGIGREVPWPKGVGARRSDEVVATVQRTIGAVGYAAEPHAQRSGVQVALIANRSGRFVSPDPDSVAATLYAARGNDADLTLEVPLTEAPAGYPIAGFCYLIFRVGGPDRAKEAALVHLTAWTLMGGQASAERLGYAPVPLSLRIRTLSGLRAGGVPVKSGE